MKYFKRYILKQFNIKAFTLAEVLVTLTIIGVIAALTVPQLIQKTDDQQLRVKWKKTFSDIQHATDYMSSTSGIDFTSYATMRASYGTILNFVKEDSWGNISGLFYTYYKNTTSSGWNSAGIGWASAVLSDGTFVLFSDVVGDTTCSATIGSINNMCAKIFVDTNGKNGPNMYGKDFFDLIIIKSNGNYEAIPAGSNGDGQSCAAGSTTWTTSEGCSTVALSDGPMP